ncbi:MAG: trypsin-like peptidase domain-containing protein [Nanoarchaeota archaeon]|nr:trypsin-like peptidase domain-containing protein [Nanoarchaeota archaeon]
MRLRHRLLVERLAVLVFIAVLIGVVIWQNHTPSNNVMIAEEYVAIAEHVIPAVVAITADGNGSANFGSGIIIDDRGYIVTNNHVLGNASEIRVLLPRKDLYAAQIVGVDSATDIAVLKINASNLPVVKLGDSDKVVVGEKVLAVGNPFGLDSTITAGIISAKNRDRGPTVYRDFLQTDASINPGNSGGPLVNLDGEVIGMNTFILTTFTGDDGSKALTSGLGFAIPSNTVKEVAALLIEHKFIVRGFLGVKVADVVDFNESSGAGRIVLGANVTGLFADAPAGKAGIKEGDIIKEVDGVIVESSNQLKNFVGSIPAGREVVVVVERVEDGNVVRKEFKIILSSRPVDVN